MNKKQIIYLGVVIVIVGIFLIGFNNITGKSVYSIKEIDLAINPISNSALIFIAEENGYFLEEGLKVKYHSFPTGKLALDALIGGGADIATTADVPIALAGLAGQDISVIATIEYSSENIQVVARKGINKPSDLRGKKIATTKGGGPLFYTHMFLERYNIDIEDVKLIHLNPSDMVTALFKKEIDAFIVFEPSPSIAREEIKDLTIFAPNDLYGETWNIVVVKENRVMINKFLKALLKAEQFLKNNKEKSIGIVSKYTGTDKNLLVNIMDKQNYEVTLNKLIIDYPRQEAEWAIRQGLSSSNKIPNYYDLIKSNYLLGLKEEAVKI